MQGVAQQDEGAGGVARESQDVALVLGLEGDPHGGEHSEALALDANLVKCRPRVVLRNGTKGDFPGRAELSQQHEWLVDLCHQPRTTGVRRRPEDGQQGRQSSRSNRSRARREGHVILLLVVVVGTRIRRDTEEQWVCHGVRIAAAHRRPGGTGDVTLSTRAAYTA